MYITLKQYRQKKFQHVVDQREEYCGKYTAFCPATVDDAGNIVVPPTVKSDKGTFLAEYTPPKQVVVVTVDVMYTFMLDELESSTLNPLYV